MDEPIVQYPGEGELVFDDESGTSRIKVARDELLLSETTLRFGARGAKPHFHREHADAFYVLEGSLDFHVAGEQRSVEAHGLVLAPPGLVHGFEVGPNGDRHLNIHAPGAAFARLTRARRDGVSIDPGAEGDTFSPPENGGLPASEAVVHGADEGEHGESVVKAARPEISLLVLEFPPGGGVDPHYHERHSDSFYVLEGELEIHLRDEVVHAVPGTYALAPPRVVHYFRNVSESPVRFVNLHTPGGFAEYRRELRELRSQGIEPDRAFFERHDIFDVQELLTQPNVYSATWHAVFGATQPPERTAREVAFLARVLPSPEHGPVLDVCCGSGRHLAGLAALGYEVTGVERDSAVAEAAREAVPGAQIVEGDTNRLAELVDGPFGGVISMWQSFGYGTAAENAALLRSMASLLEAGGRLVLDVYNRAFFETRTGTRTIERDGRTIREQTALDGDRLTTSLDYGSGIEDVFSWQLFTPEELTEVARSAGLAPVLAWTDFEETVPASPDQARMQLVFARA